MPEDDNEEVLREYRALLGLTLDKMPEEDKQWFPEFDIENIAKLDAMNRLEHIREEKASLQIGAFEKEAWDLALKYSNNEYEENAAELKEKAKELKQNIKKFIDGLEKTNSNSSQRFARIISEALLDCEYVIGDKHVASFRMGNILRQQPAK